MSGVALTVEWFEWRDLDEKNSVGVVHFLDWCLGTPCRAMTAAFL
jgi:hypothetical protein